MTLALESRTTAGISALASGKSAVLTRMLMEGALERIEAARDREDPADGLLQSAAVLIAELRAGLDLRHGGVFAANVDDLYDYICRRLHAAGSSETDGKMDSAALHEVWHLLEALRTAWTFMPAEIRATSVN